MRHLLTYFLLLLILLMGLGSSKLWAQTASGSFEVRLNQVTTYYADLCYEAGTEEYSAYANVTDNADGSSTGTGCLTCDASYDCTYGYNVPCEHVPIRRLLRLI